MLTRLALAVLLLPVGCATTNGFQVAMNEQMDKVGVVPTNLSNVDFAERSADRLVTKAVVLVSSGGGRVAVASAEEGMHVMAVLSVSNGEACVVYARDSPNNVGATSPEGYRKAYLADARRSRYQMETFESLASLPPRPTVIEGVGTRLEPVQLDTGVGSIDFNDYQFINGKRTKKMLTEYNVFTLCGPAPVFTSATRYVTVSVTHWAYADRLFVWEVTDAEEPTTLHVR